MKGRPMMDTATRADMLTKHGNGIAVPLPLDDGDRGYLVLPSRTLTRHEADRIRATIAAMAVDPDERAL